VVNRRIEPSARHGAERVGDAAHRLEQAAADAALFTSGAPARPPFLFFDLETTGLSGGAGTLAFLVGCGWFEADGAFLTRQFLLTRFVDERPLLGAVAARQLQRQVVRRAAARDALSLSPPALDRCRAAAHGRAARCAPILEEPGCRAVLSGPPRSRP
jgi:hypothetical protein